MSESKNGVSWLHRFATLLAVMTFLVLMTRMLASGAGAAMLAAHVGGEGVGGNSAGNPLSKYAHIYKILAAAVGVLTLVLTVLLSRSNFRRYIKTLAGVTLGILLAAAILIFHPIERFSSVERSFSYMCGIQVFFCLTVCLALFTRGDWRWDEPKTPDVASPSLRQILVFMTAAIFLQPLLGEGFQQGKIGITFHFVLGIAVTVCSLWVLEMALTKFAHLRSFKISTIFLAELVGLEFFLGIVSYSMDLNARSVAGSQPGLVVMDATHAAVGALVLATSLFVTFQAFKYFACAESKVAPALLKEGRETEPEEA